MKCLERNNSKRKQNTALRVRVEFKVRNGHV